MRKLLIVAMVVAGCTATASPSPSPSPTPTPSASPTSSPIPTASPDAILASAVTDALASIDAITRIHDPATTGGKIPTNADYDLMAQVATSERTSLAREPARITTKDAFHLLDLILQAFEQNAILDDPAELESMYGHLLLARDVIAGLEP
jgi:hypothetical protein